MSLCGTEDAELEEAAPVCPLVLLDGLALWSAEDELEGEVDCEGLEPEEGEVDCEEEVEGEVEL
jgi:hypothetical protein